MTPQLFDNDDLKGAMERIVQNPQLNSVEFYVVTNLIPQPQSSSPQPSCPQLQLLPPQQLPYNNIDLNNQISSYNIQSKQHSNSTSYHSQAKQGKGRKLCSTHQPKSQLFSLIDPSNNSFDPIR